MPDTPRPETIDDLPSFHREPETVARIELPAGGFGVGLGAIIDQLVDAYGELYADAMTVKWKFDRLEISRDQTPDELQARLDADQRSWDYRAKRDMESEQ